MRCSSCFSFAVEKKNDCQLYAKRCSSIPPPVFSFPLNPFFKESKVTQFFFFCRSPSRSYLFNSVYETLARTCEFSHPKYASVASVMIFFFFFRSNCLMLLKEGGGGSVTAEGGKENFFFFIFFFKFLI